MELEQAALLFDENGSEVKKKETKKKDVKTKKNELPPGKPRIIRYAGETIILDEPEQMNWELEQIRQYLEETLGYPELTKDRTEMIYDKKKDIVIPVIKARKAGAVINSRFGQIDPAQGELKFSLPKIPGVYLNQILKFFKMIYQKQGTEAMAWILWDPKTQKYLIEVPIQHVTPNSIDVDEEYLVNHIEIQSEFLQVVHLHSHGKMNAFFSKIDDAWETGIRIYGVVGTLDLPVSKALFRVGCGGKRFIPIKYTQIFTKLDPNLIISVPKNWFARVKASAGN
jgi:PRTRC genetic system protein A